MKLIVPMARKKVKDDSRFVPPNPLMNLVGRPILIRVLDVVKNLKISEVIFIVDRDDDDLKFLISKNFKFKVRFVLQKNQKGVAHAIFGARKFVSDEPCLVLFADSIVEADLKGLDKVKEDAVIWVKKVDDPRSFGVVFTHNGFVTRLIEKPETPISDLAMVGMYYFKNSALLFDSVAFLIKNKILTKGAFQITDALQIMINKGASIVSKEVSSWLDCGSKKKLIESHKDIIFEQEFVASQKGCVFIKPVFVEKGALVRDSIIGPNVSIAKNANVSRSIISDSIICEGALVENEVLDSSFVGRRAKVYGSLRKINLKDRGVIGDE